MRALRTIFLLTLLATPVLAQTVAGFDPHLSVGLFNQNGLFLAWNDLADAGPVTIRRQEVGGAAQQLIATQDAGTLWILPGFDAGTRAVYRVTRRQQNGQQGEGVVIAGLDFPFRDDQGIALVLVDAENATTLRGQLDQLNADLADDGFEVIEQSVARTETPPQVKDRILGAADGGRLTHVVLLGAIPRAFSGIQFPDGHPDHNGAWPADPYYGDLTGTTWTDVAVGGQGAFFNDAGDGKFDNTFVSAMEVAVGRVDFENMPVFGADAGTVQLGKYLDKVHRFRTGQAPLARRALFRDNFGYFGGEAFARAAWRDSAAILGVDPEAAPFFPTLEATDGGFLLAWGCGGGGPTSVGGVTSSSELAQKSAHVRFMGVFGSYFGDWSFQNDVMRATLGSGDVVATLWFARPSAQLHALGAMESFGTAFARDPALRPGFMQVYRALLGDPTLRLFYPLKLASVTASVSSSGVELQWPSFLGDEQLLGYHVYRKLDGQPPVRVTGEPTTFNSFIDTTAPAGVEQEWRVVAVVRERTGSGTYFNHSLGARVRATPVMVVDAGPGDEDAGVDAGTPTAEEDAGVIDVPDAGPMTPLPTDPEPTTGGCGCQSVDGTALISFALLLIRASRSRASASRRTRRSPRPLPAS